MKKKMFLSALFSPPGWWTGNNFLFKGGLIFYFSIFYDIIIQHHPSSLTYVLRGFNLLSRTGIKATSSFSSSAKKTTTLIVRDVSKVRFLQIISVSERNRQMHFVGC